MSALESVLLLAVVAGLFVMVIGVVMWTGNREAPGAPAAPVPAEAASTVAPSSAVDVSKGLRRADRQDDLDALLEQVDAEEALEAMIEP